MYASWQSCLDVSNPLQVTDNGNDGTLFGNWYILEKVAQVNSTFIVHDLVEIGIAWLSSWSLQVTQYWARCRPSGSCCHLFSSFLWLDMSMVAFCYAWCLELSFCENILLNFEDCIIIPTFARKESRNTLLQVANRMIHWLAEEEV